MSRRFKGILLICVILMQICVLSHFTPFGVIPNYTMVVLFAIIMINPDTENLVTAGITGAVTDILTGAPFGINTLLCIYLAIGCVFISQAIYNKRVTVFAPLCFAASFIYEIIFGIFSCLLRGAFFPPEMILKTVLPLAAVNTVIFIPVYEVLRRIRFEKKRKGIKYEQ